MTKNDETTTIGLRFGIRKNGLESNSSIRAKDDNKRFDAVLLQSEYCKSKLIVILENIVEGWKNKIPKECMRGLLYELMGKTLRADMIMDGGHWAHDKEMSKKDGPSKAYMGRYKGPYEEFNHLWLNRIFDCQEDWFTDQSGASWVVENNPEWINKLTNLKFGGQFNRGIMVQVMTGFRSYLSKQCGLNYFFDFGKGDSWAKEYKERSQQRLIRLLVEWFNAKYSDMDKAFEKYQRNCASINKVVSDYYGKDFVFDTINIKYNDINFEELIKDLLVNKKNTLKDVREFINNMDLKKIEWGELGNYLQMIDSKLCHLTNGLKEYFNKHDTIPFGAKNHFYMELKKEKGAKKEIDWKRKEYHNYQDCLNECPDNFQVGLSLQYTDQVKDSFESICKELMREINTDIPLKYKIVENIIVNKGRLRALVKTPGFECYDESYQGNKDNVIRQELREYIKQRSSYIDKNYNWNIYWTRNKIDQSGNIRTLKTPEEVLCGMEQGKDYYEDLDKLEYSIYGFGSKQITDEQGKIYIFRVNNQNSFLEKYKIMSTVFHKDFDRVKSNKISDKNELYQLNLKTVKIDGKSVKDKNGLFYPAQVLMNYDEYSNPGFVISDQNRRTERNLHHSKSKKYQFVGIDLGINSKMTLCGTSNISEMIFDNTDKWHIDYEDNIAERAIFLEKRKKQLSRKMKLVQTELSKPKYDRKPNINKASYLKLQKAHKKICADLTNLENTYFKDKIRKLLTKTERVIIGDFNNNVMSKSNKGDANVHGKGVAAKTGLNREIKKAKMSWIRAYIERMSVMYNVEVWDQHEAYTSKICVYCNYIDGSDNNKPRNRDDNDKTIYVCNCCNGKQLHADEVGAFNMIRKFSDNISGSIKKGIEEKIGILPNYGIKWFDRIPKKGKNTLDNRS